MRQKYVKICKAEDTNKFLKQNVDGIEPDKVGNILNYFF